MLTKLSAGLNRSLEAVGSQFCAVSCATQRQPWELSVLLAIVAGAAALRFWGLGSWGLENDEDSMAMATMHIVRHGGSVLPSGMVYVRAISQIYMMAASVIAFGESEWAFRLPSVLCGLLLIPITYLYGRRCHTPTRNMAFVAAAAVLPGFIADSQEARMYIFMLACLAGYGVFIVEWEQTDRMRYLACAVVLALIGLQFHTLTVFGSFLVLFPGLLHQDWKKLFAGIGAFVAIVLGYLVINRWVGSFYPPRPRVHGIDIVAENHLGGFAKLHLGMLPLLLAIVVAGILAFYVACRVPARKTAIATGLLAFAGLVSQLVLFHYLGFILLLASLIVARRNDESVLPRFLVLGCVSLALATAQFFMLHAAGVGSARKVVGAMLGLPSVWPQLRLVPYAPAAMLLAAIGLVRALWDLAHRRRIADYWLFLLLGVWLPLTLLGLFSWNVEPRYTEFALLPLLVCAFASAQRAMTWLAGTALGQSRAGPAVCALVVAMIVANPLAVAHVVNAGYTIHPDHKGAAEYIKVLQLSPNDLLVAEDVLQQTYYLGRVDYWLVGQDTADEYSEKVNGELRDIYTHTRIIGTGSALNALLGRSDRGAIYVIGSGEQQEDGRRTARSFGIFEALHSDAFTVVYSGRDRLTQIWKVAEPGRATSSQPVR